MALKSVLLPAPFEPTMVANSPSASRSERLDRARFSLTVPALNVLEIWETSSIGLVPLSGQGAQLAGVGLDLRQMDVVLHVRRGDGDGHDDGGHELEILG